MFIPRCRNNVKTLEARLHNFIVPMDQRQPKRVLNSILENIVHKNALVSMLLS